MKNLHTILLLLAVAFLAACHDNDIEISKPDGLPDPNVYISFAKRAPAIEDDGWMLLPLPGQNTHTVLKDGYEYEVPQNFGVFGYFTDDDASNVIEPATPVFGVSTPAAGGGYTTQSDILEQYDENDKFPDIEDGNLTDKDKENDKRRTEIFDHQEEQFYRAAGEKQGDGTVKYYNGAEEDANGVETKAPDKLDNPDKEIVTVTLPFGTRINEDGSVEMADGTKISKDGTLYRTIMYKVAVEGAVAEEEKRIEVQIKPNGELATDLTNAPESFITTKQEDDITVTITFPDGTVIKKIEGQAADTPIVTISFMMMTADGASISVDYSCSARMLVFNPGENSQNIDLGSIWDNLDKESGNQTNPVKPRRVTRADTDYDDQDDKYFYGYDHQRWKNEDYMFYGYAPASRNANINLASDGTVGSFTWDKIPCVSTTDYVVAKEEVWRKNKTGTPDVSRIHFDEMQHLMARVRLYFAVHPDFHKIRRVVVTQASLSFQEAGFKKVYTFENKRDDNSTPGHSKEKWTWTVDDNYVYNPKYNTAFYSSLKEAHPSDMVVYQNREDAPTVAHYGKLLAPLPTNNNWHPGNLFTDFYIVPYDNNQATDMTLHVKYNIYDTDPEVNNETVTEDGHTMLYYSNGHLLRECQRESTIHFKSPMKFQSGVSHALKIMINPDYIYVLGDHDEPADVIIR